jgi:hypothetical protein
MALDFMNLLDYAESMGVFNILMPFLLVFAIVFAILEKINLFGSGKRQINGIVAAVFGVLVIRNQYIIGIINRFLPNIALFMVIILMFLLLIGVFMGEHKDWAPKLLTLAVIISVIFVIWALSSDFIGQTWDLPNWLYGFNDTTKAAVIFIGIFVGVIYWVTRPSSPPTTGGG